MSMDAYMKMTLMDIDQISELRNDNNYEKQIIDGYAEISYLTFQSRV